MSGSWLPLSVTPITLGNHKAGSREGVEGTDERPGGTSVGQPVDEVLCHLGRTSRQPRAEEAQT